MTDGPWAGDASSLVDEFRAKRRSPVEELEASLNAIAANAQKTVFLPYEASAAMGAIGGIRELLNIPGAGGTAGAK